MDMIVRPRRLRTTEQMRKMVRETRVDKASLIYPIFAQDGENIKDVIIDGPGETEGIGQKIIDEWPLAFVEYNGIVDTYSGATFAGITRAAVIEAMRQALQNAGVNPDDYMREMEKDEAAGDVTVETDIVVVGAGGAGRPAADDEYVVHSRLFASPFF